MYELQLLANVGISYVLLAILAIFVSFIDSKHTPYFGTRKTFFKAYSDNIKMLLVGSVIAWVILWLFHHLSWSW